MNLHYFELARSGKRVLFRENEYTNVMKPYFGAGLVLTTRSGKEFRVTTSVPTQIDAETTPKTELDSSTLFKVPAAT